MYDSLRYGLGTLALYCPVATLSQKVLSAYMVDACQNHNSTSDNRSPTFDYIVLELLNLESIDSDKSMNTFKQD